MLSTTLLSCNAKKTSDELDLAESGSAQGSDGINIENETPDNETPEVGNNSNELISVFANGAYSAKIIKAEMASELDEKIYNKIKAMLKSHTGVNPAVATDFVPLGEEKYDGPAILIGETNYSESTSAYKKLSDNSASATVNGNKYVIAFSSEEAAEKLVDKLKALINKNESNKSLSISSSWKASINLSSADAQKETFNEAGLVSSATLPNYEGAALGSGYDGGQGSKVYIKSNASKAKFDTYCTALENAKFTFYTANSYGSNSFATYVTQTQIVNVMLFEARKEIRITVDKRGSGTNGFSLPGLSGENDDTKVVDSSFTFVDNNGWSSLCMIYKLSNGKFFVIDSLVGGRSEQTSAPWLYKTLKKLAGSDKIVVQAWLITHIHSDHLGGLVDIARGYGRNNGSKKTFSYKDNITIEKLIYNQPSDAMMNKSGQSDRKGWANEVIKAFNIKNVVKAHPGQIFYIGNAEMRILSSQDLLIERGGSITSHNEYSIISQITFNGKTLIALADSEVEENARVAQIYGSKLKSDILQVAHHGYGETGAKAVNDLANPDIVLFPNVQSHWESITERKEISIIFRTKDCYGAFGGNLTFDKNWKPQSRFNV